MGADSALLQHWVDTATRAAIIDFVTTATTLGGPEFVAPAERVAVFDNDGTLWCEKPMQIQLDFTVRRLAEQADQDPSLQSRQPWKAAHEQDYKWLGTAIVKHYHGDDSDLQLLMVAVQGAFSGITVEDYQQRVRDFFGAEHHPVLSRAYPSCGYEPMVELIRYLEAAGFTVYIASGGDRDFMRAVAEGMYGIPPDRVIGSSLGLSWDDQASALSYTDKMEFFDDGPTKPVRIWSRIGRRPTLAVGNANGDIPMLAQASGLRLVVRHDDGEREFAYDDGAEDLLARAADNGWTTISMKDDWNTVFISP
jgi:phosphoglycolate phosphatase-like HAD superfamily hydrolase